MPRLFLLLVTLVLAVRGQAANEDPLVRYRVDVAFVLGLMPDSTYPAKPEALFEPFTSDRGKVALLDTKLRQLARALGIDTQAPAESWQRRLTDSLRPVLTDLFINYQPRSHRTFPTVDSAFARAWDNDCARAYILGSYCLRGRDYHISSLPEPRAWLIVESLDMIHPVTGINVSIGYGQSSSRARVELPQDSFSDQLVADADRLLAEAAKRVTGAEPIIPPSPETLLIQHNQKIAFLMGISGWGFDPASPWRPFFQGAGDPKKTALLQHRARALAEALGLEPTKSSDEEWQARLYGALKPVLAEFYPQDTPPQFLPDPARRKSAFALAWDNKCARAYVLGSYLAHGKDYQIGYLPTVRAGLIGESLNGVFPGGGFLVTTTYGYIPGGSRLELSHDKNSDQLIAEAKALLENNADADPTQAARP